MTSRDPAVPFLFYLKKKKGKKKGKKNNNCLFDTLVVVTQLRIAMATDDLTKAAANRS